MTPITLPFVRSMGADWVIGIGSAICRIFVDIAVDGHTLLHIRRAGFGCLPLLGCEQSATEGQQNLVGFGSWGKAW